MSIKQELRNELISDAVNAILKVMKEDNKKYGIYKNCLNCQHFGETAELCNLAAARPPVRVLVQGCSSWEDLSIIPF